MPHSVIIVVSVVVMAAVYGRSASPADPQATMRR
jgi:hypothetical protein